MFKGILSSRRIASSDFTMITPLGDANAGGKENLPGTAVAPPLGVHKNTKVAPAADKGYVQASDKKKRGESKKGNGDGYHLQGPTMNKAFDRLLVWQTNN
jgi:hypothetical protein